ncbi:translation initiation factor IF-3 [Candidatus Portiera aleyrodidarum MED (Bemisia tabaci)]|uniref:Translation initiation factor IF-3 n=1 Tax=Candidatus Portiera aleyrodidarum MED (Bemisia tabaci) TaxID=1163752 RepID=A0AAU8RZ65_9GAMM|nr:translation initiation factor IF-3 [Candidatus Portiera aleyrodidarum MED (Bemisia tabaci)]ASX27285.1 translation initiation factor IF-3 [Candidatus Portiera aleyrodidarum MED (Bemisia tabaci)]AUI73074.1 translation initiation factor IF-3 [Candidatus Portiera aleyrodidarum]
MNRNISATKVRLIGKEGEQLGIVSINEARNKAEESGLDLVQIYKSSDYIVCKIMDYGKFVFEKKKQRSAQKKNNVKEIKFRPVTSESDYKVKIKSLMRFIEEGDRSKVTIRFRGREIAHKELGKKLMERILIDLKDLIMVESKQKMEGKQMTMMITPKKHN